MSHFVIEQNQLNIVQCSGPSTQHKKRGGRFNDVGGPTMVGSDGENFEILTARMAKNAT
mgnify:CR=1 FL=1